MALLLFGEELLDPGGKFTRRTLVLILVKEILRDYSKGVPGAIELFERRKYKKPAQCKG
jgi:hypothetical protein